MTGEQYTVKADKWPKFVKTSIKVPFNEAEELIILIDILCRKENCKILPMQQAKIGLMAESIRENRAAGMSDDNRAESLQNIFKEKTEQDPWEDLPQ